MEKKIHRKVEKDERHVASSAIPAWTPGSGRKSPPPHFHNCILTLIDYDRASDLISLFSFVWFFLGNVWLYSGTECKDTSPYMWWSTLTILIISYIRVAELAIIILAVVFFLPRKLLLRLIQSGLFWATLLTVVSAYDSRHRCSTPIRRSREEA